MVGSVYEKKQAEKQQSQKTEVASKPIEQFIKIENTDDIPELEGFEYKNRRYEVLSGSNPNSCGIRNRSKKGSPLQYIHPVTKQAFSLYFLLSFGKAQFRLLLIPFP